MHVRRKEGDVPETGPHDKGGSWNASERPTGKDKCAAPHGVLGGWLR